MATGTSATEIIVTLGEGPNFSVGDAVLVGVGAGATEEVAWVTAISTDTLTLSPALSATPSVGDTVGAGVHYKLFKNELQSFFGSFWQGDSVRYDFTGSKVSALAMNFATGEIIKPAFSLNMTASDPP